MNYLQLYDFLHDIGENLNQTVKIFHGRPETIELLAATTFRGLNIYILPFSASGSTTGGAQLNTSWNVEIIFYQLDTPDSDIDQNDEDKLQDEMVTVTLTQQAAEKFLRLANSNDITDELKKNADRLIVNTYGFDTAIKDGQLLTGTVLTLNLTVPDNFDYCALDFIRLFTPTLLAAVAGDTIVDLTWENNSESPIEIHRSLTTGSGFALIATTARNAVAFNDTGLTNDTEFFYKIRAVDGSNFSDFTNEVSATPVSAISAAAQSVLDRMPNALAAGEQDKIIASVDAGIAGGSFSYDSGSNLFSPVDACFGLFLEDAANKNQDWFADRDGSFPNGFTDVLAKGASLNGTTQYFDSVDLSTLTNYSLNDAFINIFVYAGGAGIMLLGVESLAATRVQGFQDGTTNISMRIHSSNTAQNAIDSGLFLANTNYGFQRDNATQLHLLKDNVDQGAKAANSDTVPSGRNLFVGAKNNDGIPQQHLAVTASLVLIGANTADDYNSFISEVRSQWALDV